MQLKKHYTDDETCVACENDISSTEALQDIETGDYYCSISCARFDAEHLGRIEVV